MYCMGPQFGDNVNLLAGVWDIFAGQVCYWQKEDFTEVRGIRSQKNDLVSIQWLLSYVLMLKARPTCRGEGCVPCGCLSVQWPFRDVIECVCFPGTQDLHISEYRQCPSLPKSLMYFQSPVLFQNQPLSLMNKTNIIFIGR